MCQACQRGFPFWIGLLVLGLLVWQALPATNRLSDEPSEKQFRQLSVSEVEKWIQEGAQVVDVREPSEFAEGHIAESKNIPLGELERRLEEISKEKPVVVVCRSGNRSSKGATLLIQNGYPPEKVGSLKGGLRRWVEEGRPLVR